jgi:hypothetical protein
MSTAASPAGAEGRSGRGPSGIILIVLGSVAALIGLVLVLGALFIVLANATQRDDDGFFTTSSERFVSPGYALTNERVEVWAGGDAPRWLEDHLGTVKVTVTSDRPAFVGIGPADDVEAYLADVERTIVRDVRYHPFRVDQTERAGRAPAGAPADQGFWAASASGSGERTLTWEVAEGSWSLAVMNADGSRGVAADVSVGGKVDFLGWLALGLLGAGALFVAAAALLLAVGIRGTATADGGGGGAAAAAGGLADGVAVAAYPVQVEAQLDPGLSRWRWLVKWFLAIPHWFLLVFLWAAFCVLTIVAFFAILFTGRYPRAIFDFNVGVLRWSWRVAYFATNGIGTDRYPPFTLADVPDYPARISVAYPERLSRGLVLVKSWLLAIPHLVVVALFVGGIGWGGGRGWEAGPFSLNSVLFLVAGIVLLFTGRYPQEVWRLAVGINRWALRVVAYVALMRDEYPPFRLDP